MTHVYPLESDPERIWLGKHVMHMAMPNDDGGDLGHSEHEHAHDQTVGPEHHHDPR